MILVEASARRVLSMERPRKKKVVAASSHPWRKKLVRRGGGGGCSPWWSLDLLGGGITHKGDGSLMQVEREREEEGEDINHTIITQNTQGDETTNPDDLNTRIIQVKSQPSFIDNTTLL